MGYMVNGCGTSDKYKKISALGNFHCATCNAETPFYVYEHTKRVAVFFVPVVKYKTDFWLGCDKCNRGRVISEEEKNQLIGITG